MRTHGGNEGRGIGYRCVTHLGDDVAHLDARIRRGTARHHRVNVRAGIGTQLVALVQRTGDGNGAYAQIGMRGRLALDDLGGNVHGVVHGNGEAHARVVARIRLDHGIDADESTILVDQGTTGIAGVNGRVGLDHVRVNGCRRRTRIRTIGIAHGDGAIGGRNDARCHRLLQTERTASRHNPLAFLQRRGISMAVRSVASILITARSVVES